MSVTDVRTVMWKELRELGDMLTGGSRAQMVVLILVGMFFGIVSPLRRGVAWLTDGTAALSYAFIGMVLLMQPMADTFAGERERHTLETLLSTRLGDSAILLGKLFGVLAPVWAATAGVYLVAIVATNVLFGHGHLVLPPLWAIATTVAAIVLVPGLMAGIGINASMHANTVRKAAQVLSLFVMGLVFVPLIVTQVLPRAWAVRIIGLLNGHSAAEVGIAVGLGLLVLDVAIVTVALARFRRGRLLLD